MVAKVDGGLDFPGGLTQFKKRFSVVNIILIAFLVVVVVVVPSISIAIVSSLLFVVAAIVLNSLNTSVFFRCVRFLRQEFFLLLCKKVELILGCFFTFFFIFFSPCIKRFFLFFFVFRVFLCSFLRFFHRFFFAALFSSTHTTASEKIFQLLNHYKIPTMASSLTFSASVGQQQKVFSVKHATRAAKREFRSKPKPLPSCVFVRYSVLSFFYVCM